MTKRIIAVFLVLSLAAITGMPLAAQENIERRVFHQCVLYKGADGNTWVAQPLVSLGMIGVMANAPLFRLSSPLAKQYAPLVNELAKTPAPPEFWWWGLPSPKDARRPLMLVRLEATAQLTTPGTDGDPINADADVVQRPAIYEITSARLICAEFVPAEWVRAWKTLDAGLNEIVARSRTAPDEMKKRELGEAIDRCVQAYNTMVAIRVSDESRKVVQRVEPTARAVRLFQQDVAGAGAGEWGGQLREYITTLAIDPSVPLSPADKPCPAIELLMESDSGKDLIARIRKSWPEETLDQRLLYSNQLDRIVFIWETADLSAADFATIKAEGKQQLAQAGEHSGNTEANDAAIEFAIEPWHAVFRAASPELLAQKGLLRGLVVASASGEPFPIGLQAGDIVIDYDSSYDLVMGRGVHFGPEQRFKGIARYGGKLAVLRGDRRLVLNVKVQQ